MRRHCLISTTRPADEILGYRQDGTLRLMVLDASALLAVLLNEPDAAGIAQAHRLAIRAAW